MSKPRLKHLMPAIVSLSAVILCAISFVEEDPADVRYRLIFHNFLDSEPDASSLVTGAVGRFNLTWHPDTSTFFHDSTGIGQSVLEPNGRYLIRSLESSWYGSPAYTSRYTKEFVGADYPDEEFAKRFRDKFGSAPFSRILRDARKAPWHFWSGEAVESVFKRYYGGPENRFQRVTYGFIYDVAAKSYMTDYVNLLNHLLVTRRNDWLRLCDDYHRRALTDTNFHGPVAANEARKKLFTPNELRGYNTIGTDRLINPIGELMRRQIDGSLPGIIRCIRVILRDYDPENHRRLKV